MRLHPAGDDVTVAFDVSNFADIRTCIVFDKGSEFIER
jgi:hypothetical protein